MRRPLPVKLISAIAVTAAAVATASCATTSPSQPGPTQSGSAQPTSTQTTPAPPTTSASTTPVSCPSGWKTGPVKVTRNLALPPVPVATAIRTGSHPECRFDRLVIDINGAQPGYAARFVATVIQDGSGQPIAMPGTSHLVVTLDPAQGHTDSGTMLLHSGVHTVGYPMLKSYAVAGDFEAVLTVALGLNGGARYRIGELPGKIYIDVAW